MKITTNTIHLAFALFAFASFAPAPEAKAVCQEGCLTDQNTVLGEDALSNNSDFQNTAIGFNSLHSQTNGRNTAIGAYALYTNTGGTFNTAVGGFALYNNVGFCCFPGCYNTAIGDFALYGNTTGAVNTAIGNAALDNNTTGNYNTASGGDALSNNTIGSYNTASGWNALSLNSTGNDNTATGRQALYLNSTGSFNTATGTEALEGNKFGSYNIAVGFRAGELINSSNNIDIGNIGAAADSGIIRVGTPGRQTGAYVAGISGVTVPQGAGVIIDTNGHLGTISSSARCKEKIKPMDKASEAILALKPVTFRYKHELDPEGISQFGLVAEDVEKVNPDLVVRDEQGKPYTVRYDAVNAMLLNEFLKEYRTVQQQGATIARLEKQVEMLTAGLQKVNAQLELSEGAPQSVSLNH
jgi:hypothetical protein